MKRLILTLSLIGFLTGIYAQNYPVVTIADIQQVSDQNLAAGNDASPRLGDTVIVEGVVTFDPCVYGLSESSRKGSWIQDPDTNAWNGLHVLIDPNAIGSSLSLEELDQATKFFDNFKRGNKVRCTGIVDAFSNGTQLVLLPEETQIVGLASEPDPHHTTIDTFMQAAGQDQVPQLTTGEQYEGVLVEFQNVTIVDVSSFGGGSRVNWVLQDAQGNQIQVRDASGWFRNDNNDTYCNDTTETPWVFPLPNEGSQLAWFRGIITEYALGGERAYWVAPRDTSDLGPLVAAAPVVRGTERSPVQATSTNSVTITADIIDPDGSVANASLFYSVGVNSTSFTKLPLINTQGNDYVVSIPPTNQDGAVVNYWIRAIDNSGDTTDYPFTNATTINYITLDDGINEISDLNFSISSDGSSIWSGDSLASMDITAVVTSTQRSYDLGLIAVQDSRNPYSGLILQRVTGDNLGDLRRGDSIRINSGVLTEEFSVTNLSYVNYDLLGQTDMPDPITTLNPDSVAAGVMNQAEAYEGMYVNFMDAFVIDTNADAGAGDNFGEWSINTNQGASTGLRVDDYSNDIAFGFNTDSLDAGQQLDYIQGILWYSFGNYKLLPRNKSDIAGFNTNYPKRITLFSFIGLGSGGSDVILNIDNDANIITTQNPLPSGTDVSNLTPFIEYEGVDISPDPSIAQDFSDTVYYTVTAPIDGSTRTYAVVVDVVTGIETPEAVQSMTLIPNPSVGDFNVRLNVKEAGEYQLRVINMMGQEIINRNWNVNSGSNLLPINGRDLSAGLYLIQLEGEGGSISRKLQISK